MKQVTMIIKIDERRHTVELRRAGCSAPAYLIGAADPEAVAGAWRALAAYALESAFCAEHSRDFCAPAFTNREREQMALRVCDEYKNLFEIDEENPSAV